MYSIDYKIPLGIHRDQFVVLRPVTKSVEHKRIRNQNLDIMVFSYSCSYQTRTFSQESGYFSLVWTTDTTNVYDQ